VRNLGGVVAVAAGTYFSLALKADGTVWAWGVNGNGQLGRDVTTSCKGFLKDLSCSVVPIPVRDLIKVKAIAAGAYHGLALIDDGTVWAWGSGKNGELGNGTSGAEMQTQAPAQVGSLTGVAAIAAGYHYSVALRPGGA
jgi:alpha-tubulin suppressor-like RCC1 family protein